MTIPHFLYFLFIINLVIFRPLFEKFGATFDFDLMKRGYFPKGGGEVVVTVNPVESLKPVDLTDQGKVTSIYGWAFAAGTLPIKLAHQLAYGATEELKKFDKVEIERYKEDRNIAPDNCAGIM